MKCSKFKLKKRINTFFQIFRSFSFFVLNRLIGSSFNEKFDTWSAFLMHIRIMKSCITLIVFTIYVNMSLIYECFERQISMTTMRDEYPIRIIPKSCIPSACDNINMCRAFCPSTFTV